MGQSAEFGSQAGMMPRYYINDLGGAAEVNMLVGLAPSNYGTTLDGINALGPGNPAFQPACAPVGPLIGNV